MTDLRISLDDTAKMNNTFRDTEVIAECPVELESIRLEYALIHPTGVDANPAELERLIEDLHECGGTAHRIIDFLVVEVLDVDYEHSRSIEGTTTATDHFDKYC